MGAAFSCKLSVFFPDESDVQAIEPLNDHSYITTSNDPSHHLIDIPPEIDSV